MEDIRERIRNTISVERKKQRARVLNENRPALGECIENASYSPAFVTEIAKKLKKKTLNVNDYRHLQNALIQSESNIEAFLKVNNIIFALARDISGNNPISQLGATNCCCNIALGNTKACAAIAKYISPYLITECESLNCPLLEVCLWTIGNLSSESKKAFEILHAQKCLCYLIKLLNECDNKILPSVVYAALHYLYGGFSFIKETELVELAEACKNRHLFEENSDTLWLLALLSSNVACGSSLYYVLPSIVDFLHRSIPNYLPNTSSLIAACLRILGNLLTTNTLEDIVNTFLMDLQIGDLNAQEFFYVGSIAVIIGIYIWVLLDSCASLNGTRSDVEIGATSITRFGSLKRAHISRARTAPTSFYIRVGALLFGLATLVFNGLEMAMHSMMQGAECLTDVIFAHPVLHGLFTFLQMHFLFVNSQVLVERFGLAARFGFTHLAATNIAVWVRLVIWDSAQEWTYFVYLAQRGPQTSAASTLNLRGFPGSLTRNSRDLLVDPSLEDRSMFRPYRPISNEQISQVIALQECLNTNTLGQLWTSSLPFLYPFIVQFSLIAAAVTFVMGQNVGRSRIAQKQKFHAGSKDLTSHSRVGCDGSSKGLFLGILCMVAGIVVILIFLVVREDEQFSNITLSWLTCGTLIGILALSGLMTSTGLIQIRQMPVVTSKAPAALDSLLSNVAIFGVQLYSIFTIVVCACSLALLEEENEEEREAQLEDGNVKQTRGRHIMLLSVSILQLIQCFAQSTLIAETSRRSCITRFQMLAKPGRQVITFLLFTNAVLWAFDTVITQNWLSQELQLRFFGVLVWGILSRIGLPLLIFYRFHSCVLLLEAWNKCYRTPIGEHPLN